MALIQCPECGKEISDKAKSCPSCGCPVNKEITDSYLCCPNCGSHELHSEQNGFEGGKALAGYLLVGGIGLLAGNIGSKDVMVTCLACGKKTKAGNLKTVYSSDMKKELEENVRNLLCKLDDFSSQTQAKELFMSQYGATEEDWMEFNDDFNKDIENDKLTPEQKKVFEDSAATLQKGGCSSVIAILVILTATLFFIL